MQGWHHLNRNNNLEVCLGNLHFEDYLILILWPIKMNFLPLHLIRFLSLYPLKETKYEILTILKITAMLLCLSNGSCENKTEFLSSKGSQGCCDPSITEVWLCHWKSGRLLPKHSTPHMSSLWVCSYCSLRPKWPWLPVVDVWLLFSLRPTQLNA